MSIKGYFTDGPSHWLITRWLLILLLVASFVIAFNKDFSDQLKAMIAKNDRKVLSTVNGDILNSGELFKVIKVKEKGRLFLEVYGTPKDGSRTLFATIPLPDSRDGYFLFGRAVTNLALKDLDDDQKLEIIAPSYDAELNGHLNIFQFNVELNRFEKYIGPISN